MEVYSRAFVGGFDLAAEWMGWENVFHCEWNEFGQKVLKHYWPKAISYADITKTDFSIHRGNIDILTGGFPCQPYSQAGKRLGKEDDRHLWPEMLRAIREIQPSWVVGENVLGLVNWNGGLVFHEVQTELEAEGYEVQPFILPACAVNAPHRRDRVWFLAYSNVCSNRNIGKQNRKEDGLQKIGRKEIFPRQLIRASPGTALHSNNSKQQRECFISEREGQSNGSNRRSYERPAWSGGLSQSPVCGRNDGVSRKLDENRLFALGNAIVPQVALQIFKAIEQYEKNIR